jgi:type IV pilus assembly protein PilM
MAELEVTRSGVALTNFGLVATPPNAIIEGQVNEVTALGEAIQSLHMQMKSKRRHVSTAMWGASVNVKRITLPKMEESVLAAQIKWEAKDYIPFDIETVTLDFSLIKNSPQSADASQVLLVAAQKEMVQKMIEAVDSAGLKCQVMDVAGFALVNCFMHNYANKPGETVALLNFGASVTNFAVVQNREAIFCRDILVGGNAYTIDISKRMGLTLPEAEALKVGASTNQGTPQTVFDILRETNEAVTDEIARSMEFYSNSVPDSTIHKVIVSGGCIGVPGLVDQVSKSFNVGYEVFNPMANISVQNKNLTPEYIQQISSYAPVVLGLALRKARD